eukprot:g19859.t1
MRTGDTKIVMLLIGALCLAPCFVSPRPRDLRPDAAAALAAATVAAEPANAMLFGADLKDVAQEPPVASFALARDATDHWASYLGSSPGQGQEAVPRKVPEANDSTLLFPWGS